MKIESCPVCWFHRNWRYIALFAAIFVFTLVECYDADPNPPLWFTYYQDQAIRIALELLKVVGAIFLLARIFQNPQTKK